MWRSQEKILGHKVNEKIFRVDPGKEKSKKVKKILFSGRSCFEKLKQFLGGLAIFHKPLVSEGLWKIAKSPEVFQMQLFSTEPVVVQLSQNFGFKPKIGNYGHHIFYLLSF